MEINDLFVCVTNAQNIIPLFLKKVISHDPLQKIIQIWLKIWLKNKKNKFYGDKIKLHKLNLFKKNLLQDRGVNPSPMSDRVKKVYFLH